MQNILIIAGEVSGDQYASKLAETLKNKDPKISLHGIGGTQLKAQTDYFVYESAYSHAMGNWEHWKKRRQTKIFLQALEAYLETTPINKAILIDFQHANFQIATILQKYNIPIYTFISPNFWIWKDTRSAQKIAKYSHTIFTIFEQEYELYRPLHPRVYYFGHPLLSIRPPMTNPEQTKHRHILTLFPGSRDQEIHYHFPAMLKAIQILQKNPTTSPIQIAVMNPTIKKLIDHYLKKYPIQNIQFKDATSPDLLANTRLLLCVAGTVTLEALLTYTPMIVLGAVSPITFWLGTHILKVKLPRIALPNIVMNQTIIPEFIQNFDPTKIAETITKLDHKMLDHYPEILKKFTKDPNPFQSIATALLKEPS
ncbi:MAG: hypothetical protein EXS67_03360 [Candidatus Margulisbacteria bacterium]|nr:hypothetical protein [Candidatus Margulisiibacteriota bacterium]